MGSTMHVHLETDDEDEELENSTDEEKIKEKSALKSTERKANDGCWARFASLMDFDLLLDIRYLNILFGLSITYVAELNFKLLVPFFMANLGFSKRETAKALSLMAVADISARILIPPILDRLSFTRRSTLMVGLTCVAVARSVVAEQTSWTNLIASLIVHGFFRGFALINFPLVVSEAVVPEKFAAAFGLSMVAKGIFIVALGPLSGWIRDYTKSYSICLHTQSVMIMICVVAWSVEYIIFSRKRSKQLLPVVEPP